MTLVIPDKTYFKIGEVSKLIDVKPYILRYWESEFKVLRPHKSRSRHRLYRRRDVEILLQIRQLLYTEKFTIAGAKIRIQELIKSGKFVPGKSGLAITQSEFEERSGSSEAGDFDEPEDEDDESGFDDEEEDEGERELVELSRQLGTAQELIAELQEALATATDGSIERELDALRGELRQSRLELAEMQKKDDGELDELRRLKTEHEAELEARSEALAAMTHERDALQKQLDELTERETLQASKLEDAIRAQEDAEHARDEALARVEALEAKETSAPEPDSEELDRLESELAVRERERDEARATVEALREELAEVKDQLATALELEEALDAERGRVADLETELETVKTQAESSSESDASQEARRELERKLQYQVNFHSRVARDVKAQLAELLEALDAM